MDKIILIFVAIFIVLQIFAPSAAISAKSNGSSTATPTALTYALKNDDVGMELEYKSNNGNDNKKPDGYPDSYFIYCFHHDRTNNRIYSTGRIPRAVATEFNDRLQNDFKKLSILSDITPVPTATPTYATATITPTMTRTQLP